MLWRRMFDFPSWDIRSTFAELDKMRREMDRLADALTRRTPYRLFTSGVFPLINLTEDKDNYYIRAELPGMKAEELDIQVTRNSVSIAGERKIPAEDKNANYHRREREAGSFSRIITLPGEINADKVEATMANGILTITIAKAEAIKPKQITVK